MHTCNNAYTQNSAIMENGIHTYNAYMHNKYIHTYTQQYIHTYIHAYMHETMHKNSYMRNANQTLKHADIHAKVNTVYTIKQIQTYSDNTCRGACTHAHTNADHPYIKPDITSIYIYICTLRDAPMPEYMPKTPVCTLISTSLDTKRKRERNVWDGGKKFCFQTQITKTFFVQNPNHCVG